MNKSMNKRCGIWGVWLAAMMLCLGSLPGLAMADEQDVAEETGEATAPPLAVAPFDAAAAKAHQEAWAKHLGVPVEVTNSIGMKLVLIPPGEFMMGSPETEADRDSSEEMLHRVRITKPFYLGMYEVTQSEYERVMGRNPSAFSSSGDRSERVSGSDTSRFPVETVAWKDAMEFCRRLSATDAERSAGRVYRLPTEAEWEYACRAGSNTKWSFGDSETSPGDYAWYSGNSDRKTHPVGQKKPNAWGLYDMHGNVWEWCQDWRDADYYAASPTDDPQGPSAGWLRVTRGGGGYYSARACRSAYRGRGTPDYRSRGLGFRLAFSPVDQSGQ